MLIKKSFFDGRCRADRGLLKVSITLMLRLLQIFYAGRRGVVAWGGVDYFISVEGATVKVIIIQLIITIISSNLIGA